MSEMEERVARALESADIGWSVQLTRLVDGEHTYTLTYDDGSPELEFSCHDDAYAHIAAKKRRKAARAAIEAMREPTMDQLAAGQKAWLKDDLRRSSTLYRAMIDAALDGSRPDAG